MMVRSSSDPSIAKCAARSRRPLLRNTPAVAQLMCWRQTCRQYRHGLAGRRKDRDTQTVRPMAGFVPHLLTTLGGATVADHADHLLGSFWNTQFEWVCPPIGSAGSSEQMGPASGAAGPSYLPPTSSCRVMAGHAGNIASSAPSLAPAGKQMLRAVCVRRRPAMRACVKRRYIRQCLGCSR